MRSWNFVTFDQVSGRVTSISKATPVKLIGSPFHQKRSLIAAAMLIGTIGLCNLPSSQQVQVLSSIQGTASVVDIPVEAVESTERIRPPFFEKFGKLLDGSFMSLHADSLRAIANLGSSADSISHPERVVSAVAVAEDSVLLKNPA